MPITLGDTNITSSTGNLELSGSSGQVDSARIQITGAKTISSGIPQQQLNILDTTTIAAGVGGAIAFSAKYNGNFTTTMASIEGVRENGTEGHYPGALKFKTRTNFGDNTERMSIDSSGRVTKPFQPAFKAGRNSSYTPGASTDIIFNDTSSENIHFNIGGHYNTANGRFTAPVAGMYYFITLILWETVPNNTIMSDSLYINRNGTFTTYSFRRANFNEGTTGSSAYFADHAHVFIPLGANDYVTVNNAYAGRIIHGNSKYSWFAGYLLG